MSAKPPPTEGDDDARLRSGETLRDVGALRRRAEAHVDARALGKDAAHEELRIHQIELELQHEELQRTLVELELSHTRYRALFEELPVAVLELDETGRVRKTNAAAEALLDVEPGDLFRVLGAPGEASALAALVATSGRGIDARLRARTGYIEALLSVHVGPGSTIVTAQDVSVEHASRERLRRSEANLRALWDASPDGIAVVQEDVVVFCNQRLAELLACAKADALGTRLVDLFVDDEIANLAELSSSRAGRLIAGGAERPVACQRVPIDYEGQPAELWSLRDLSERKRLEANLSRAERLASIGMLISGVAHEINNPLAFVLTNLELLATTLRERGDDPELVGAAEDAHDGAQRLGAIVADLKAFQRSDDRISSLEPNALVVQTLRLAEPKVLHRAALRRDLGLVPSVAAPEGRLAQVLLNLVLNAVQAMPAERAPAQNRVDVRTYATATHVCFAVADNGVGIPEDKRKHIFDPFYTTRRSSGGTGLGLAICDGIVQQLGGYIEVTSELGRGSTFTVHLPIEGTPSDAPPRSSSSTESPAALLDILIVDDELAVGRALRRALSDFGQIHLVGSGNEAIAHLEDHPETTYDVILSDLVMPDGSGYELLDWLQAERPSWVSRLIFMSGMPHPEQGDVSAIPRVSKPFDIPALRALVTRAGLAGRAARG